MSNLPRELWISNNETISSKTQPEHKWPCVFPFKRDGSVKFIRADDASFEEEVRRRIQGGGLKLITDVYIVDKPIFEKLQALEDMKEQSLEQLEKHDKDLVIEILALLRTDIKEMKEEAELLVKALEDVRSKAALKKERRMFEVAEGALRRWRDT